MELNFLVNFLQIKLEFNNSDNVNIIIDSRVIKKNDIFVGIKGNNFDGNNYAQKAIDNGALLAIVDNKTYANGVNIFYVADSIKFLGDLATSWRNEINPLVFAITGSSGKTTVKEMLTTILKNAYSEEKVLATIGNFNNHIGLPLTLLSLTRKHKYAVLEMGMNHFGEIKYLSQIARPDYALINNIHRAHIGCGFDNLEAIAKAKSEIFIGLQGKKTVILPQDDLQYKNLHNFAKNYRQISFAINDADISAQNIQLNYLNSFFQVNYFGKKIDIFLPIPGLHNIRNALATCAMIYDLKIASAIIIDSLRNFKPVNARLNILKLNHDITLINDTYNANPESMIAAIDVLDKFNNKKIIIMGDMGELGNNSVTYHLEIAKYILQKSIDLAVFIGKFTKNSCAILGKKGTYFQDQDSLVKYLIDNIKSNCTILIKGSRFMKMENIVFALQDHFKMD